LLKDFSNSEVGAALSLRWIMIVFKAWLLVSRELIGIGCLPGNATFDFKFQVDKVQCLSTFLR